MAVRTELKKRASPKTMPKTSPAFLIWLGMALLLILIDQLSKILIVQLFHYGESLYVTDFFNIILIHNPGAAFSFLAGAGGWQRWFFTIIGLGAASFITWLLYCHAKQRLFCFGLSFILGGALGNVIDRLIHGHVIDFLDFHWQQWHWPAFNIADSVIFIGAFMLIVDEIKRVKERK